MSDPYTAWKTGGPVVGGGSIWLGSSFDQRRKRVAWERNREGIVRAEWDGDGRVHYYPDLDALMVSFEIYASNQ